MSLHLSLGLDARLTISRARVMPDRMRKLYNDAFPEEERRPQADLDSKISDGKITLWLLHADDADLGFLTVHELPSGVNYVEHFAVDSSLRGAGIGSAALSLFAAMEPGPIVLEAEPAGTNPMASRRIGFYRRQGFDLWEDYPYKQPPYSPGMPEVELRLMTRGIPVDFDIHSLATEIRREVYRAPEQLI